MHFHIARCRAACGVDVGGVEARSLGAGGGAAYPL